MAQLSAPFVHPRPGEGMGKKKEKEDRAKKASRGRFAPGDPPMRVVK
jgi:hypothetical protein